MTLSAKSSLMLGENKAAFCREGNNMYITIWLKWSIVSGPTTRHSADHPNSQGPRSFFLSPDFDFILKLHRSRARLHLFCQLQLFIAHKDWSQMTRKNGPASSRWLVSDSNDDDDDDDGDDGFLGLCAHWVLYVCRPGVGMAEGWGRGYLA